MAQSNHISIALLTLENVESALLCISSPASAGAYVKQAETHLLGWESLQPDQYADTLLRTIERNRSTNPLLVCGAILVLKAAILRHWSRSTHNSTRRKICPEVLSISPETKCRIRQFFLHVVTSVIYDESAQLQARHVLSKLARLDPNLSTNYPQLLPTLFQHAIYWPISQPNLPVQRHYSVTAVINALMALECVMEELNMSKSLLLVDKNYILNVIATNFHAITLALEHSTNAIHLESQEDRTALQYATLLIKTIHKLLLIVTLTSCVTTSECSIRQIFHKSLLEILPVLLNTAAPQHNNQKLLLLDAIMEMIVELQITHPEAFMPFVLQYLHLFYNKIFLDAIESDNARLLTKSSFLEQSGGFSNFVIFGLRYISNVLSCTGKYSAFNDNNLFEDPTTMIVGEEGQTWFDDFFTASRFVQFTEFVLTRLMPATQETLQVWQDDPESYYILFSTIGNEGTADNVTLQLAAQNLYLAIMEHSSFGRSIIAPYMSQATKDTASQMEAARLETTNDSYSDLDEHKCYSTILLWDSLYSAIGLSANVLGSYIDVNSWFDGCLYPCLFHILDSSRSAACSKLPILRFRLIWLIGCFGHLQSTSSLKLAHSVLAAVLVDSDQQNDVAVRLAATQCMSDLLYLPIDYHCHCAIHDPCKVITNLYKLLSECNEIDSIRQVMTLISQIIDEVGNSNVIASAVMAPLTEIWQHNDLQYFRKDILQIITKLSSTTTESCPVPDLFSTAISIIDDSLYPCNYDEDMIENILALWFTLLRKASSYDKAFQGLFGKIIDIIRLGYEHLIIVMKITEMYILLGGSEFLSAHSSTVSNLLSLVVAKISARGMFYTTLVTEALLRKFSDGVVLLRQAGIFETMLKSCACNVRHQKHHESDRVVLLYLTSLSRGLLVSPNILDDCFPITVGGGNVDAFHPHELVEILISRFETIVRDGQCPSLWKKLWAIALLSLLPPTPSVYLEQVLKSMNDIIRICVDVLALENSTGGHLCDAYYMVTDDDDNAIEEEADRSNYGRLIKASVSSDIAVRMDFRVLLKEKLAVLGLDEYREVLRNTDMTTVQQLQNLLQTTDSLLTNN